MEKKQYDAEYHKRNIKGIYIPFNMATPDDAELYEFLRDVPNKARYIKDLIDADRRLSEAAKIF